MTTTTPEPAAAVDAPRSTWEVNGPMERVNAPQTFFRGFGHTAVEVWRYRELLVNLIRKDLKVKYKGSVLGFFWSLARPLLLLLVYFVAIGQFLGNSIPSFVVFLFSGLVMWFYFSDVVGHSVVSITGNAGLIKKVYFPRELLPLAAVGVAFVQFICMLVVLFAVTLATGRTITPGKLLLLPVTILVLLLFSTAVALLVSAANVFLRDTQHLVEVFLLLLFYMSPILYAIGTIRDTLTDAGAWVEQIYLANPIAIIAFSFQEAIYQRGDLNGEPILYSGNVLGRLLVLGVVCCGFLWLAQRLFARASGNFAQSL